MNSPLVVANWKMHGSQARCAVLARQIVRGLGRAPATAEVVLAPPFTSLDAVQRSLRGSKIRLAAQNCHWEIQGAYTGEVSPTMVRDLGCNYVIVGHSERRHIFHESDEMISRKLAPILSHGMRAILCVGETLDERQSGKTTAVIRRQLRIALKRLTKADIANVEIAYEPVWAIGTGQNATPKQINQVHSRIRTCLMQWFGASTGKQTRILYGGSVKPENVDSLVVIEEINGLLVGGASLNSEAFLPIVRAFLKK
jgi:triosephosphate isomerase (TIM)